MVRHRSYIFYALLLYFLSYMHTFRSSSKAHTNPWAAIFIFITSYLYQASLFAVGEGCSFHSNGLILENDVNIYSPYQGSFPPPILSWLVLCFQFVCALIISAMVATWYIWLGINGCLLSLLSYLRDPDKNTMTWTFTRVSQYFW